jgi:hypothetical protein
MIRISALTRGTSRGRRQSPSYSTAVCFYVLAIGLSDYVDGESVDSVASVLCEIDDYTGNNIVEPIFQT